MPDIDLDQLAFKLCAYVQQQIDRLVGWEAIEGALAQKVSPDLAKLAISLVRGGIDQGLSWVKIEAQVRALFEPAAPAGPVESGGRELVLCTNHGLYVNHTTSSLVVKGKHFKAAPGYEGQFDGLREEATLDKLVYEDCILEGFKNALNFSPMQGRRARQTLITKCILIDSWKGQGLYGHGTDILRIERTLIDQCGWRQDDPGNRVGNVWDHCIYENNGCTEFEADDVILANPANYGAQFRAGIKKGRRLFVYFANNAIRVGGGDDGPGDLSPMEPAGVWVDIEELGILGRAGTEGIGLEGMLMFSNVAGGSVLRVVMAGPGHKYGAAVQLSGKDGVGVRNLRVEADLVGFLCEQYDRRFDTDRISGCTIDLRVSGTHTFPNPAPYAAAIKRARTRPVDAWDYTYSAAALIAQLRADCGLPA